MTDVARIRLEKRYAALKRKKGACAACIHRDRDTTHHGWAHCRNNVRRQHPRCAEDAKKPTFALDVAVIDSLRDGREG